MIIIVGTSGSGKSTYSKQLKNKLITHTTRQPRIDESDDYYFVDEQMFQDIINNDEFIEYSQYANNWYGLSKNEINRYISRDESDESENELNVDENVGKNELDVNKSFDKNVDKNELNVDKNVDENELNAQNHCDCSHVVVDSNGARAIANYLDQINHPYSIHVLLIDKPTMIKRMIKRGDDLISIYERLHQYQTDAIEIDKLIVDFKEHIKIIRENK